MMYEEDRKICMCDCHVVGCSIIHFDSCCKLCYKKYIIDGEVDNKLYKQALKEIKKIDIKRGNCDYVICRSDINKESLEIIKKQFVDPKINIFENHIEIKECKNEKR